MLDAQELPPGSVGVPVRRWRYASLFEDPTDRRCANAVAEFEELAPDSLVTPSFAVRAMTWYSNCRPR
jgi:hypothetical protein